MAGSLALILAVFLLTAVLVKVQLAPAAFFAVTMLSVVVINCEARAKGGVAWTGRGPTPSLSLSLSFRPAFGAVLQGSLFGMAGALPAAYTAPIMSGQGLAGTFAALAMICAIASMIGRRLPSLLLRVPPRHPASVFLGPSPSPSLPRRRFQRRGGVLRLFHQRLRRHSRLHLGVRRAA